MPVLALPRTRAILAAVDRWFEFNPNLATFTAGMAKRATSVFAAAPIVQGTPLVGGASDSLSFPLSTQVSNYFYTTLDENQGSIVMWITPEAIGLAYQYLFWFSGNFNAYIGTSYLCFKTNAGTVSATHGFTAGSTYCIVLRWDLKNTIDGTNYMSISINDVHTFGATTSAAATALLAGGFIGTKSSTDTAANAIIQGLTIYRRVLFDGTYGQDVGNGDEINLIYNSGTGKDPTLITGSWDVTFCLPTDSTAGALTTGAGNAWSHPHSSNVLKHGWLEDWYYGGGAWAVACDGESTRIDCGSNASLDNLHAGTFTYEAWVLTATAGVNSLGRFGQKGTTSIPGWNIGCYSNSEKQIDAYVGCETTNAYSRTTSAKMCDGKWHHVVMYYSNTGDRKIYIAVDGVWEVTYSSQGAGVGTTKDDSATNLFIGGYSSRSFVGSMGWARISNNARYTPGTNFIPPRTMPAADANTVEQWAISEGTGSTVAATVNAANNGTIMYGTWESQWQPVGTPVIPYSVEFNGTSTQIDCGADAGLLDITDNAFTVEFWQRSDTRGASSEGGFIEKISGTNGWVVKWRGSSGIEALIACATTNATSRTGSTIITADGKWHHVAVTWDDAGDRKLRIFIDGNQPSSYSLQNAGVGAIKTDTGINLKIGQDGSGKFYDGGMGWIRISNSVRYTTNFIPPSRIAPPAPDGNTIGQWNMAEGSGTVIDNAEGTAGRDGTLSNGTWNITPAMEVDSPGGRTYNWGYVVGSDAANEGVKQVLTGLTAGANYVLRVPVYMGRTGMSQPYVMIYDETNGAEITRINGDWSGERVQNGDFEAGDTKWSKGTGWTIAGGVAHCDGTQTANSNLSQGSASQINGGVISGHLYKVTFTLANYAGGTVRVVLGSAVVGITRTVDGTYTEILRSDGTSIFIQGNSDFIGDIDNVSVTPVSEESKPDILMCSFELPTIARNGTAADCTSISIQLLNAATGGVCGWQQGELLPNLIDNPSLDTGAGTPWIPTGWYTSTLTGTQSIQELTDTHSGKAFRFQNADNIDGISSNVTLTLGAFYSMGCWGKWLSGTRAEYWNGFLYYQSSSTTIIDSRIDSAITYWKHIKEVGRCINATTSYTVLRVLGGTGTENALLDDLYLIALDPVTLTVTPASLANSTESTGIRVDGKESCTQSVINCSRTKGNIKAKITPRHNAADMVKFGTTPVWLHIAPDANNYILLDWSAANTLRLRYNAGGAGVQTGTADMTGAIVAGTTYIVQIAYTGGGMTVSINGVAKITISAPVAFSADFVTAYWLSDTTPANCADATIDRV